MTGVIWLIVEDDNDFDVMKQLLNQKGIAVPIKRRKLNGNTGGVSRLAEQLEEIIRTIKSLMTNSDCIIVLHDADEFTRPNDRLDYEHIANICRTHSDYVSQVIARDELESWILADSGFCAWIGQGAKNWDMERRPSDHLRKLMKAKTGSDYGGRYRAQVVATLSGDGDTHSPSMKAAFEMLVELDCVKA